MCATVGLTLIITFAMARENRRRDRKQFSQTHDLAYPQNRGLEKEKELGAPEQEEDKAYIQRDVSDGQNKSFRYTL